MFELDLFRGRRGRRAPRRAVAALALVALPLLPSCSFLVPTDYGCAQNADCYSAKGEHFICKRPPGQSRGTCVDLESPDCAMVYGDWKDDDAFIFGSVLPTTGPDLSTGKACENAITLAIDEFTGVSGLPAVPGPGSRRRRPLVLVGCSDQSSPDIGARAARHLAEDVGVPAILGAQWSGVTRRIAYDVTIGAGVLLLSPTATAISISDMEDDGLVWRTAPSDIYQGAAMAHYVPVLEQQVRAARSLATDAKIKVALLYQHTDYGTSLSSKINDDLMINGLPAADPANASYFRMRDYGEVNSPNADAVTEALEFRPDIAIILGTNEGVTKILEPIEDRWANEAQGAPRPRWVLGDGGQIHELWDYVATNEDLRKRITGTVPGSTNRLFVNFQQQYLSKFRDGTSPAVFGPAGSYDSVYLLAYAAVSLGATPVTGHTLSSGFSALVPRQGAQPVNVGYNSIAPTFGVLSNAGTIDFNGASGPLDFDLTKGEALSDIQIWCLPKDAAGKAAPAQNSGLYLEASSMTMKGSFSATCN